MKWEDTRMSSWRINWKFLEKLTNSLWSKFFTQAARRLKSGIKTVCNYKAIENSHACAALKLLTKLDNVCQPLRSEVHQHKHPWQSNGQARNTCADEKELGIRISTERLSIGNLLVPRLPFPVHSLSTGRCVPQIFPAGSSVSLVPILRRVQAILSQTICTRTKKLMKKQLKFLDAGQAQ